MIHEAPNGRHIIALSLLAAMVLTIIPLPLAFEEYRPHWLALVLLYWTMALPHRVGVGIAWLIGLSLDVFKGAFLGQHALAMAVLIYMMLHLHLRLRIYPFWQQSVVIGLMLVIYQALLLWIYDMTASIDITWSYWTPAIVSAVLWPWMFVILRDARRKFHVR